MSTALKTHQVKRKGLFPYSRPVFLLLLILIGLAVLSERGLRSKALQRSTAMHEVKFITLDPGHFHAALVHKEMYPGVSKQVSIYAPLGADLLDHLNRIVRFNTRKDNPTDWRLEIHTEPDFMDRMLKEHPGNVVVLSGRNRAKIDRIKAALDVGLNVLSDKPWIISVADLPKLEAALNMADEKGLVAYDIMTERYEITTVLQRELIHDEGTFGHIVVGSERDPAVYMESVHYLMKTVAGAPNLRPAWFFDINQQGEGLTDVGTHLVDLVQWMLFPEKSTHYRKHIKVLSATRWPTVLTKAEFQRVTNEPEFPEFLSESVKEGRLNYFCNNLVSYTVRGVHTKLKILWNYEAAEGSGDTHFAVFKGTKARLEIRQGREQKYRPELYVMPNNETQKPAVLAALNNKVAALQREFPGVGVEDLGRELQVIIPDRYRVGHEAHFAQVTNKFLGHLKNPSSLPAWEKPNMLAKYYVTTKGVELSQHRSGTGSR